jgi:hypothetical protein
MDPFAPIFRPEDSSSTRPATESRGAFSSSSCRRRAIPGASVDATNKGTGAVDNSVTTDQGTFSIPALNPGTYTVTVSLQGFKTVVLNDVVLNAAVT